MANDPHIERGVFVPEGVNIGSDVSIGPNVVFGGNDIVIGPGAMLDAACVISNGVTIGRGAWVRAGAVVLHSMPAHSIVVGNPAEVVGYVNSHPSMAQARLEFIDLSSKVEVQRPGAISLNVGNAALHLMRRMDDKRGSLSVAEMASEMPFVPARYFTIYDVPAKELRGEHAHKLCQQFFICVHGSCHVLLDDGINRCEVLLDRPDIGLFVPEMIWGTQYRYSSDAVLLVFASMEYDCFDYLHSYDDFISQIGTRMVP